MIPDPKELVKEAAVTQSLRKGGMRNLADRASMLITRGGVRAPHVTEAQKTRAFFAAAEPRTPSKAFNQARGQAKGRVIARIRSGAADMTKKAAKTPAWTRSEGKSKSGGLNAKGVASYRRENPGSKLQTAVTTKPSKLKPGSKAAKRRKSFCSRMSGMPGPMEDEKGRPTRKALSLRRWNC